MTFRVSVRCFADSAIQITLFVIWNNSARFSRIEEKKKKKQYGDAKRYSIEVKRRAEYCVRQCTVRASGKLHLGRQTVASLSFSILRLSRFALLIRQLYLSRSRDTPDDLPPALFGGHHPPPEIPFVQLHMSHNERLGFNYSNYLHEKSFTLITLLVNFMTN